MKLEGNGNKVWEILGHTVTRMEARPTRHSEQEVGRNRNMGLPFLAIGPGFLQRAVSPITTGIYPVKKICKLFVPVEQAYS